LVDDDEDYWTLMKSIFERPAFRNRVELRWVKDGAEALRHLEDGASEGARRPDLVLLDERMPTMDGTQLLERITLNPRLRSLQVCLMATTGESALVELALGLGARFCIEKPTAFDELDRMLTQIVDFYGTVALLPRPRS
ncbi:MAG: response regulator, partial [Myxococcota bacterium]